MTITAFCSFNGVLVSPIDASDGFNVKNIIRTATGKFTINFDKPMESDKYGVHITTGAPGGKAPAIGIISNRTKTSCEIETYVGMGWKVYDPPIVCVTITSNL